MNGIIQYIILAITISIISSISENLQTKSKNETKPEEDGVYVVRLPAVLYKTCLMTFCVGCIGFMIFMLFKIKNSETVTLGHFVLALVIAAIGLIGMMLSKLWRIEVNQTDMAVYRFLRLKKQITVKEIDRYEIGKKGEMRLYVNGKKLTTVDPLADNYDMLLKDLKNYKKQE